MSPITILIFTILLSNKVISKQIWADEDSEEYPNLSCHKGFHTPDEFGLVLGPFTKKLAVQTCKGIDALVSLPKTHECYRRCLLEQLFVLGTEEYSKNGLDWNYEKTGLNCEEDMIGAMSHRLFNVKITGTDTVSRLVREIHLKCADKAVKLETRPCKEWKPFNDCVDSIWLCKNHTTTLEAAKISAKNLAHNVGFRNQIEKETNVLLGSLIILLIFNIAI